MIPVPVSELEARSPSKGDLFAEVRAPFDYGLPSSWLYPFAEWCATNRPHVTLELIKGTTVWAWPDGFRGYRPGAPLTACSEVQEAIEAYSEAHR